MATRTAQAASFDQVLKQAYSGIDTVVYLAADDEEIVRRLCGRSFAQVPDALPHHRPAPKTPNICDLDKTPLIARDDDVRYHSQALKVYHELTEGLITHYRKSGVLREVKAQGDKERVYQDIVEQLKKACPRV